MTKAEAGSLGGKKTAERHGRQHMQAIGRKGAQVTWSKYQLIPLPLREFAMVDRVTRKIVAVHK